MRKEKVTPTGSPAPVKPMNRGMEEQEQKGVTVPSRAERVLAPSPRKRPRMRLLRSGGEVALDVGDEEDQEAEQQGDLRHVVEKKLHAAPQPGGQVQAQGGQACADGVVEPGHAQDLGLEEIPWGHWGTILSKSGR